jgi:hypothetical protein
MRGRQLAASTFGPNASGVGADVGEPLIARTPLALRLNVSSLAPQRNFPDPAVFDLPPARF